MWRLVLITLIYLTSAFIYGQSQVNLTGVELFAYKITIKPYLHPFLALEIIGIVIIQCSLSLSLCDQSLFEVVFFFSLRFDFSLIFCLVLSYDFINCPWISLLDLQFLYSWFMAFFLFGFFCLFTEKVKEKEKKKRRKVIEF